MRMYWQTNQMWHCRFFNLFMSSARFQHISKFFHMYNKKGIPVNNSDRLIKVRPLMDYFSKKIASVYIPKKELSLDVGTMAWRGHLSFKVYNPNKPDKYGVKFYMLAEGTSGYIYKFDVYCGIGKMTVETVMGLMAPLVNKGYHLYMDNYYNSVSLTEQLREVGVYTCGTLRLQRGAPKDLQQVVKGKMATDTTLYMRKDNTFVIVWKDKRPVSVITNIHNADTTQAQRRKRVRKRDGRTGVEIVKMNKPKAIVDYNKFTKGVDHFDQMIKYYEFARKTHKWTKKITFYFLQMAMHNAYALYNHYSTDTKKLTLLEFHAVGIKALLAWNSEDWPTTTSIPHAPDIDASAAPADVAVSTPGPSGARRPLFTSTPQAHSSTINSEMNIEDIEPLDVTDFIEDSTTRLVVPVEDNIPPVHPRNRRIIDSEQRLNYKLTHEIVNLAKRRRCRVCFKSGIRRDVRLGCKTCDVALCAVPCYTRSVPTTLALQTWTSRTVATTQTPQLHSNMWKTSSTLLPEP
ncbi:piggyBac transposable element-derived protein 4-like [Procambarus clarkii]|uniref:piggyBac transposable element-derived protein 4-like n=1 Tax=Procambarus clarkii TaxID=6728 RepID=UPI0037447394